MPNFEKFKLPNGQFVDVEQIEISESNEQWNEYLLEDGSVIKIKLVASKIIRVVDQYDQTGNPVYFVNSTNVISVKCPNDLKKT